jgi:hypothetical protein
MTTTTVARRAQYIWQEDIIADTGLSPITRLVAVRLALHRNAETARCFVSYRTLAAEVGISERSAMRAIAALKTRGWIAVDLGGGREKANDYRLVTPYERVTGVSRFTAQKSDSRGRERVTEHVVKGDRRRQKTMTELCHPNTEDNIGDAKASPNMEREKTLARLDPDPRGPLDAPPGFKESKEETAEEEIFPAAEIIPSSRVPLLQERSWRDLRTVWARPWPDDERADREAFTLACREVAPEDIIEAARTWVAAADAPRFLPTLAKWLAGRGWEKPPPQRKAARGGGRRNGRKQDLAKVALKNGGYVESDDGSLVSPGDDRGSVLWGLR